METKKPTPKSLKEIIKEKRKQMEEGNSSNVESEDSLIDIYYTAESSRKLVRTKTGIVFDNEFTKHKCEWDPDYPECPARYEAVMDRMNEYGLIERCLRIPSRRMTKDEALWLHTDGIFKVLELTKSIQDLDTLETIASRFDSVYFNNNTYDCALLSAGSVLNLVSDICEERIQNGMAVVRPPGHHAMKNEYNGYCFFNNVALATELAMRKYGKKRILIIDWDIHHGQGTQRFFYDNPNVLYFSIHRYEHGTFWPNLRESDVDCIGSGPGLGYNINVPLNVLGCSDIDYVYIFLHLLLPVAYQFCPDLILVSAGYDSAFGDPEGHMKVMPRCYSTLTNMLLPLAKGQIAVILEGGYFLESLAEGAALTLGALLGDAPLTPLLDERVKPAVKNVVYKAISLLAPIWTALDYYVVADEYNTKDDDSLQIRPFYLLNETKLFKPEIPPFPTRTYYSTNSASFTKECLETLAQHKIGENYSKLESSVGYCYDPVMLLHKCENMSYERPERLTAIMDLLNDFKLLERMKNVMLLNKIKNNTYEHRITRFHNLKEHKQNPVSALNKNDIMLLI